MIGYFYIGVSGLNAACKSITEQIGISLALLPGEIWYNIY